MLGNEDLQRGTIFLNECLVGRANRILTGCLVDWSSVLIDDEMAGGGNRPGPVGRNTPTRLGFFLPSEACEPPSAWLTQLLSLSLEDVPPSQTTARPNS